MPELCSFDYAIVRVVPRVEREEFVNVGVILICRTRPYLGARVALNRDRILSLDPDIDIDEVERQLDLIPRLAAGDPSAGEIAELPAGERFHWLVAPRSTMIQVSAAHSGLTDDPTAELNRLVETMVLPQNRPEPQPRRRPGLR